MINAKPMSTELLWSSYNTANEVDRIIIQCELEYRLGGVQAFLAEKTRRSAPKFKSGVYTMKSQSTTHETPATLRKQLEDAELALIAFEKSRLDAYWAVIGDRDAPDEQKHLAETQLIEACGSREAFARELRHRAGYEVARPEVRGMAKAADLARYPAIRSAWATIESPNSTTERRNAAWDELTRYLDVSELTAELRRRATGR